MGTPAPPREPAPPPVAARARTQEAAEPTIATEADTAGLADERNVDGFFQRLERRFAGRVPPNTRLRYHCIDSKGVLHFPDKLALGAPVANPSDVVDLVPWMRHADRCVRQVAIQAAHSVIQFGQQLLSYAQTQEPDDKDYHVLFLVLRRYLRDYKVNHNPAIFDGMYLTVYKYEFPLIVHGRWTEDTDSPHLGYALEVTRDLVTLTRRHVPSVHLAYLLTPRVTPIKDVVVHDLGQFVVTAVHPKGQVVFGNQASDKTIWYQFWPTSDDVLWVREAESLHWTKFRRAP